MKGILNLGFQSRLHFHSHHFHRSLQSHPHIHLERPHTHTHTHTKKKFAHIHLFYIFQLCLIYKTKKNNNFLNVPDLQVNLHSLLLYPNKFELQMNHLDCFQISINFCVKIQEREEKKMDQI